MFYEKGVLRNFPKFTEKHLCQSLFLNNLSIVNTKHRRFSSSFSFNSSNENKIHLGVHKACRSKNITLKFMKLNVESFIFFICHLQIYCVKRGEFPNNLKHADVLPAYKKKDKCDKTNHRPFNILSNVFKVFKGHRKGHKPQHSILNMTAHLKDS